LEIEWLSLAVETRARKLRAKPGEMCSRAFFGSPAARVIDDLEAVLLHAVLRHQAHQGPLLLRRSAI
jgi:hypothetical protein